MVDQKDFLYSIVPDHIKKTMEKLPDTPSRVEKVDRAYTPLDSLEERFAQATYNLFVKSPDEPIDTDFHSRHGGLPKDYFNIVTPLVRPFLESGVDFMGGQLRLSQDNPRELKKQGINPGDLVRTKEKFELALLAVLPEGERPVSYQTNKKLGTAALHEIFGGIAKMSKQKTDRFMDKWTIKKIGAGAIKTDDRLLPWLKRVIIMLSGGVSNFNERMGEALRISLYDAEAQNIYRVVKHSWPMEK